MNHRSPMRTFVFFLVIVCLSSIGCLSSSIPSSPASTTGSTGGSSMTVSSSDMYTFQCNKVLTKVVKEANTEIDKLKKEIEEGKIINNLGARCDTIFNKALEKFSSDVPESGDDPVREQIFDTEVEELERTLDAPLHLCFIRQVLNLKEKAMQKYKNGIRTSEGSDYESMMAADSYFAKECEDSIREGSDWSYTTERNTLLQTMNTLAQKTKKMNEITNKANAAQQQAMSLVQQQQAQLQQIQNAFNGGSPLNIGLGYRIPDTNINMQYTFQQGRSNFQFTCVPDDQVPFLGPQGFTHGIGPGNLGVTLNLSV